MLIFRKPQEASLGYSNGETRMMLTSRDADTEDMGIDEEDMG